MSDGCVLIEIGWSVLIVSRKQGHMIDVKPPFLKQNERRYILKGCIIQYLKSSKRSSKLLNKLY